MSNLQDLMQRGDDVLATVLAADNPDVNWDEAAGAARIDFDRHNRTILIGLGGTGVKTVDYIKGVLTTRLQAGSDRYIGYLAVDTDWKELSQLKHLTPNECVCTTLGGVDDRVHQIRDKTWPHAWSPFMTNELARNIAGMNLPGAGQKRICGRLKIHDRDASGAVDTRIEQKIQMIKDNFAQIDIPHGERYVFYVIGSVMGGTGSGGFLELPAIIRNALNTDALDINAILYLPDTMTGRFPNAAPKLNANAYAALRELNYYQAMRMRSGYSECWGLNGFEKPYRMDIPEGYDRHFYTVPYLIGSPDGGGVDAEATARSTVADFLLNILSEADPMFGFPRQDIMRAHAVSAAARKPLTVDGQHEEGGFAHEFPRCFATLGFAKAAVPKKVIRSYLIADACAKAGLKPISPEERAVRKAAGEELLPFRGPEDYIDAEVGYQQAKQLLKPILDFMNSIFKGGFDYVRECGTLEWKELIHQNGASGQRGRMITEYIKSKTVGGEVIGELEQAAADAVKAFKQNVRDYVAEEGPYAFANLFYGEFNAQNDDDPRIGIEKLLTWLKEGKNLNGRPIEISIEDKKKRADAALDDAMQAMGLAASLVEPVTGRRQRLTNNWIHATNDYVNEIIKSHLFKIMLGSHGMFECEIEAPIAALAQQTLTFAKILEVMNAAYTAEASKLETFDAFRQVSDGVTAVNIAARDKNAYNWIKRKAQDACQAAAGDQIRERLVQSFFDNPRAWTEYDDALVWTYGSMPKLANADRPIAARNLFDECMTAAVGNVPELKIEDLICTLASEGVSLDNFAGRVVENLYLKSRPLIDGQAASLDNVHQYVVIPNELQNSDEGRRFDAALRNAIINQIGRTVSIDRSDSADGITLCCQVAPFEIYKLNGLRKWEADYLSMSPAYAGFHGLSPDSEVVGTEYGNPVYAEKLNWYEDYPFITYQRDPKEPDPETGRISAEGERRKRFDAVIDQAKELGVLYAQKDSASGLWRVYRVYLDDSREWNLDTTLMEPGENGLFSIGPDLVSIIAEQNEATVAQMSKPVRLHEGGLFAKDGYPTEAIAWECARRVLYSHIPMFCEVRDTLSTIEPGLAELKRLNEALAEDSQWDSI